MLIQFIYYRKGMVIFMRKAIKNKGEIVKAYELGKECAEIQRLMDEGKVRKISENKYEIFSQEAINGKGQIACRGDFIKVDSSDSSYPNDRIFFLTNHKHIQGYEYEQIPKPVYIWQAYEDMCPEVEFLIKNKNLVINEENNEKYYTAPLWGTSLSATRDAYLIFYSIKKDFNGGIMDIDFNFVECKEFEKTYTILDDKEK